MSAIINNWNILGGFNKNRGYFFNVSGLGAVNFFLQFVVVLLTVEI
jgi:hypothetical protein